MHMLYFDRLWSLADDSPTLIYFHTLKDILCTLKTFRVWCLNLANRYDQNFILLPKESLLMVHLSLLILVQLCIMGSYLLMLFWKRIHII